MERFIELVCNYMPLQSVALLLAILAAKYHTFSPNLQYPLLMWLMIDSTKQEVLFWCWHS